MERAIICDRALTPQLTLRRWRLAAAHAFTRSSKQYSCYVALPVSLPVGPFLRKRSAGTKSTEKLRRSGAQLSSSARMLYAPSPCSHRMSSTFGLQHTWQSSTYCCRPPADSSTAVSFHSPHPAHWNPASCGTLFSLPTSTPALTPASTNPFDEPPRTARPAKRAVPSCSLPDSVRFCRARQVAPAIFEAAPGRIVVCRPEQPHFHQCRVERGAPADVRQRL